MSKNYIDTIKNSLGPERAIVFMEIVAALDLKPNDPELLLAAANASTVVSLGDLVATIDKRTANVEKVFAAFLMSVDLTIAESMTKAVDEMQTDVRVMARELATAEYSAAASLRATAINDEVRNLVAATGRLETERSALKAREVAGPGGPSVRVAPVAGVRLAVLCAVVLLIGVVVGSYATRASYTGWVPSSRTAGQRG